MWKKIDKMNLQLFADGSGDDGDGGDEGGGEKTFTQAEVTAMLAREKKQGKNSILRALGIKDVDEGLQKMNANNKDKTAEEKAAELINTANKGKADAENRAVAAERKLAAIKAGVKSEYVDDVVFIAGAKVTDDNDFDTVVEGLKKTHTFYFTEGEKKKDGTGSDSNYRKNNKDDGADSYGKRLAELKTKNATKQSDFFS